MKLIDVFNDVSIYMVDDFNQLQEKCHQYNEILSCNDVAGKTIIEHNLIFIIRTDDEWENNCRILHEVLHIFNCKRNLNRQYLFDRIYDEYYAVRKTYDLIPYSLGFRPIPNNSKINGWVLDQIGRNLATKHMILEKHSTDSRYINFLNEHSDNWQLDDFYDELEEDLQLKYNSDNELEL